MPSLHHLALRTHDLERLLAFYRHWFALSVQRDLRPRSVWLRLEPAGVLMLERAEPAEPAVPVGSRELLALSVTIEQRASLKEQLIAAGLLEGETEHTLYFRDPDGRRVALSSYPL
ncbi:MAG: Lactoylglutathione lyase [Myxococcaceae bacterium]|nr:Lactoylglutathione lyase [Myxococcaceae bacterium]